ncbi:hypothetical protein IW140_001678, partial [Coemansia sp. RSA 1813]
MLIFSSLGWLLLRRLFMMKQIKALNSVIGMEEVGMAAVEVGMAAVEVGMAAVEVGMAAVEVGTVAEAGMAEAEVGMEADGIDPA